jgi:hypothetical protein
MAEQSSAEIQQSANLNYAAQQRPLVARQILNRPIVSLLNAIRITQIPSSAKMQKKP